MISFTFLVLLAVGSDLAAAARSKGLLDLGDIGGLEAVDGVGGGMLKGIGGGGSMARSSSEASSFAKSGGKYIGLPDLVNLDMASSSSKAGSSAFSKSGGKGGKITLGGMVPEVVTGISGSKASSSSSSSSSSKTLGGGFSGLGDVSGASAASAAASAAASGVGLGGLSGGGGVGKSVSGLSGGGGVGKSVGGIVETVTGLSADSSSSSSSEECKGGFGIFDDILTSCVGSEEKECKGGFSIRNFIRLFLNKEVGEKGFKGGFFKFPFFKYGLGFYSKGFKFICKYLEKSKKYNLIARFIAKFLEKKGILSGLKCEEFEGDVCKEAEKSGCDENQCSDSYLKGISGCLIRVFGKYGITYKKVYEEWIKLFYSAITRLSKRVC